MNAGRTVCPLNLYPTAVEGLRPLQIPEVRLGGIISRAAEAMGTPPESLADDLTVRKMMLPFDYEGKAAVVFVPGQTAAGTASLAQSDVMVIGKCPSENEATSGQLFCGPSRWMWRDVLVKRGVNVSGWYLTNACWFAPPEGVTFKKSFVTECQPLLARAVAAVAPKFVLLFGADAMQAFVGLYDPKLSRKIKFKDCRGTVLRMPDGTQALVAISPQNVLVDPTVRDEFDQDIGRFADLIAGQEVGSPLGLRIVELTSETQMSDWVDGLLTAGVTHFALDAEWGESKRLRTVQLAWSDHDVAVVVLRRQNMAEAFDGGEEAAMGQLQRLLCRRGVTLTGHNLRGDVKVLRQHGMDLTAQFLCGGSDTMLMHHLLYETADQQLELVAVKLLGVERYDSGLRSWVTRSGFAKSHFAEFGYRDVPDDILHPYAAGDAAVTFRLDTLLRARLQKTPELWTLYTDVVHPANGPLLEMEECGVYCDEPLLVQQMQLYHEKMGELLATLRSNFAWPEFNPRSVDHVREVLFSYFKTKEGKQVRQAPEGAQLRTLVPIKSTNDDPWDEVVEAGTSSLFAPSTDSESLGMLAAEAKDPDVLMLRRFRFVDQIVKTFVGSGEEDELGEVEWVKGLGRFIGRDSRIRTSYRQTLETGRLATSPNLQNLPSKQEKELQQIMRTEGVLDPRYRPVRSILRATPGMLMLGADWNQAELWTLGAIAQDDDFLAVLATTDVHTDMMRTMFAAMEHNGRTLGSYSVAELNVMRDKDKFLNALRVVAKSVIFGLIYGRGAGAIAREAAKEGVECSKETAQGWIDTFFSKYPKISEWIRKTKAAVINPGYVVSPWGRHRHFPKTDDTRIRAGYGRESVNAMVQGTVADCMAASLHLFQVYRTLRPDLEYRLLISLHDAVYLECPPSQVGDMIDEVIPACMVHGLEVPKIGLHYTLGDIDIYENWEQKVKPERLLAMGVPRKHCGFKEAA